MAVRAPGDYDPNTGWPPDDSTGVQWQNDVNLPGQFKGGGAGFGPGGFQSNPRLTANPAGPPPGMSLPTNTAGSAPTNAAGMTPHIDPTTGQPEMLTGPGGLVEKTRGSMNPFGFIGRGNPYWRGAIAAGGVLTPTPAETGELSPQQSLPPRTAGGFTTNMDPTTTPYNAPPATYPHMPWPPNADNADNTHMPWPDTGAPGVGSPAPAVPVPRPAPGGAVARQRPNLGTYAAPPAAIPSNPFTTLDYRPNSGPNERNRGSPVATALDLSRLFGGGQPAPAVAPPMGYAGVRPDLAQRVPLGQTPMPPPRPVPAAPINIPIGGGAGNVLEAPSRRKSSSS